MDGATETTEYKTIEVSDTVSVEPVERVAPGNSTKILIMGGTGVGKSSFIKALHLISSPKISSNLLPGFTQSVL
ncbi:hypothetical protein BJ165DRAFT_1533635 [Panaeolus papilionaceus]|nr:hypothetical protein BJ165DRAFT_1533635 [Panaeolus papilionaceus]